MEIAKHMYRERRLIQNESDFHDLPRDGTLRSLAGVLDAPANGYRILTADPPTRVLIPSPR